MKVNILGKEFEFNYKSQVGPLYRYECLFGDAFEPTHNWALPKMVYSILWCDNQSLPFTFDEFMNGIEDDVLIQLIGEFTKRATALSQRSSVEADKQEEEAEKKD